MSSEHVRWRALAEKIRDRIRAGDLPPGTQLPPYRAWAGLSEWDNAKVGTARTVVEQLTREGWITGAKGKGVFVVGVPSAPPADDAAWRAEVERRLAALEERCDP